jgi:hypothetical protein
MPFAFLFAVYVNSYAVHLSAFLRLHRFLSGVASTFLLFFLDMKKSREECAEFVQAEARREAFEAMSARWAETGERRLSGVTSVRWAETGTRRLSGVYD